MKDDINLLIIIAAILVLTLIIACSYQFKKGEDQWNNGYCSCGGHWEYEQTIEDEDNITYIYHCDNCGKTIEIKEAQAFINTIKYGT